MRAFPSSLAIGLIVALVLSACNAAPAPTPTPFVDSRIKIEDTLAGSGDKAEPGDYLVVNYTGYLSDGTKFDSSLDRGQPFDFVLGAGQVITGWDQGLIGMQAGGRRHLTIPADLAYGAAGHPPTIPANATLVFDVDLLVRQPGVKIEELQAGTGAQARPGSLVSVKYTGYLQNGTKFDSTADHNGDPLIFVLGRGEVIKGWDAGLMGMRVGGKRRLTIPPYLAYGKGGVAGVIPGNATLVFEVELVDVQ